MAKIIKLTGLSYHSDPLKYLLLRPMCQFYGKRTANWANFAYFTFSVPIKMIDYRNKL